MPDPAQIDDPLKRAAIERALQYMELKPNTLLTDVPVQRVFIGSCTNSRIEDLRAAAAIAKGRKVADGVVALVVPGSGLVKHQAEEEGLDRVFVEAGFEWRDAGCSMCMSMNNDKAMNGERFATTSNRNFEGRQGRNAKSHLMSPAMAAAAAITGKLSRRAPDRLTARRAARFGGRSDDMANETESGSPEITVEEVRRAVLYLADAVLQLSRAADQMATRLQFTKLPNDPLFGINIAEFGYAARRAEERLRGVVDLLVKPDAPNPTG